MYVSFSGQAAALHSQVSRPSSGDTCTFLYLFSCQYLHLWNVPSTKYQNSFAPHRRGYHQGLIKHRWLRLRYSAYL